MSDRIRSLRRPALAVGLTFCVAFVLSGIQPLQAEDPQDDRGGLEISRYTIDGGGCGFCAGGTLELSGTIGQPDAGGLAGGTLTLAGGFWGGAVSVTGVKEPLPEQIWILELLPGRPNPSAHSCALRFSLPEEVHTRLLIFSVDGRRVADLWDGSLPPGMHEFVWEGRNEQGHREPAGIYYARLEAGTDSRTRTLVLLK